MQNLAKLVIHGQVVNYLEIEEKEYEGRKSPKHNVFQFMQKQKNGKLEFMNVKDLIGIPNIKMGSDVELEVIFSVVNRDVYYTAVSILKIDGKVISDKDIKDMK